MTGYIYPVPRHTDGRAPKVSSGYRSRDRPTHDGVDIMYPRVASDGGPPNGSMLPTHSRKHFMPPGVPTLCIAPGVVAISREIRTGGYVVVDHTGGLRSQYMHLFNRRVRVGDTVGSAAILGDVGFNPSAYKLLHLHFQLRRNGELIDPSRALEAMRVVERPGRLGLPLAAIGIAALSILG